LVTAVGVDFAIGGAFAFDGRLHHDDVGHGRSVAIGGSYADALSIFQVAIFAEATDDAVASANWARMGVGAGGWASGTASVEHFVFTAFWDRWEHHERLWSNLS
jgi:hypothetical protein